jgi:hypothetical protein
VKFTLCFLAFLAIGCSSFDDAAPVDSGVINDAATDKGPPDTWQDCGSQSCRVSLAAFTAHANAIPYCSPTRPVPGALCSLGAVAEGSCGGVYSLRVTYGPPGDWYQCSYDTSGTLVAAVWSPDSHPQQVAGTPPPITCPIADPVCADGGPPADARSGDASPADAGPLADARPPLVDPGSASSVGKDLCAGNGLTMADMEKLCRWGQDVLGGEGTVYQAPCLVASQDAGASPAPPGRTPLRVQSIAQCEGSLRAHGLPCAYTVGQFEDCVRAFRNDQCGAGACLGLIEYVH